MFLQPKNCHHAQPGSWKGGHRGCQTKFSLSRMEMGASLSSCTSPKVLSCTGCDSPSSQSSGAPHPAGKSQQGVPAQSHNPCRCCLRGDLSLEGSFSPAVLPSCLWNSARRKEPGQPKKQDRFGTTNVFIYFKKGWCSGDFCQLKGLWLTALPWLRPQREKLKLSHKDLQ